MNINAERLLVGQIGAAIVENAKLAAAVQDQVRINGEQQATIAERDAAIAERDAEIEKLKARLAKK